MNLKYLVLRLARHFMLESLVRFLLIRRLFICPGLESSDPLAAIEQYISGLSAYDRSINGKRVLVFGYGGRFAVGVKLLRKGAAHVVLSDHFVDLRDHYFSLPFEMLTFSENVWRNFLNPTSNLNRYHLSDYRRVFERWIKKVEFNVFERQEGEFNAISTRIRPEYLTNDAAVDSVTLISVFCQYPNK